MKIKIRHIVYLAGLLAILGSYLFWGRMEFTMGLLLILGFTISIISFITIIKKDKLKTVILGIAIAGLFFILNITLKEWLIGQSLKITISKNETLFEQVNHILISKNQNISFPPVHDREDSIFSVEEISTLRKFLDETGVFFIRKDEVKIFYPTYGAMDTKGGIFYFYSAHIPKTHFGHIKGKWYYD